jgi:hypothetical protein
MARRRSRRGSPSPRWRSRRLKVVARDLVFRNLGAAGCQRRSTLARSTGGRVSYLLGGWDPYRYAGRFQGLLHDPGQVVADRVQVEASFSRAANAATVWPASYRAQLNRRSTACWTRTRTGLNSAAAASVEEATATGVWNVSTRVARSTSPYRRTRTHQASGVPGLCGMRPPAGSASRVPGGSWLLRP